jgi:adenylylsulfate kinase-like enzyme
MSSILRSVDQLQEQRKRQTQQNKAYTENSMKLLTQVILNVNYVTFISNTKVQHKENLKIFPERTYLLIFTSTNLQECETGQDNNLFFVPNEYFYNFTK